MKHLYDRGLGPCTNHYFLDDLLCNAVHLQQVTCLSITFPQLHSHSQPSSHPNFLRVLSPVGHARPCPLTSGYQHVPVLSAVTTSMPCPLTSGYLLAVTTELLMQLLVGEGTLDTKTQHRFRRTAMRCEHVGIALHDLLERREQRTTTELVVR